jgi:hypothetical protein
MTGFIIVVVCVTGSIIWGVAGGLKRRKKLEKEEGKSNEQST